MKTEFENSVRRFSFLCCLPVIKIAWVNPCVPIKIKVSICNKLSCSSASKKSNSSLTSFLRYYKKIANLLFWIIWHAWPRTPKMIVAIWRNPRRLSIDNRQKINFILHIFLEILQRCCNLLFWVLWTCLARHTQTDTISL